MKIKNIALLVATSGILATSASADCMLDQQQTGWTGKIQFHCDQDTNLSQQPIHFQLSNGAKIQSVWGLDGKTTTQQNGDNVSITANKWWPAHTPLIIKKDQPVTLNFSASKQQFSMNHFYVGGVSPFQATIDVKLPKRPAYLPEDAKAVVTIDQGDRRVATLNEVDWNRTHQLKVALPESQADYQIHVKSIDHAQGIASPSKITLSKGDDQTVAIDYQKPLANFNGSAVMTTKFQGNQPKSRPVYVIQDANGNMIQQGYLNLNHPITIDDLPTTKNGQQYTIEAKNLFENGFKYDAGPAKTIEINDGQTTPVEFDYQAKTQPTETVQVKLKGLPEGQNATITLTNGQQQDTQIIQANQNQTDTLDIPKDHQQWHVSAETINGYIANVPLKNFIADQSQQTIDIQYNQPQLISGYWENWRAALHPGVSDNSKPAYYANDIQNVNHVIYSFLTLAKHPDAASPEAKYWDGKAIYESMTADDVVQLMQHYPEDINPTERLDNWMRQRIDGLMQATAQQDSKFIWAIGGWSDITKTIRPDQVDQLTDQIVALLREAGDGVDFDWEHLSEDPSIVKQQRETLANVLLTLRKKLDKAGLSEKSIGYTTRFNAFMHDSSRYGFTSGRTDGEGITIDHWLKAHGSSLNEVVDWVNIMAYDVPIKDLPNHETWSMPVYQDVYKTFADYISPDKIVMGFEPGGQSGAGQGGTWEGMGVDQSVIQYAQANHYGGTMFWALNQTPYKGYDTGENAQQLAQYAHHVFN